MTAEEIQKILSTHHNDINGHLGMAATLKKLKNLGIYWSNMREDVVKFVLDCPACQKQRETVQHKSVRLEKVIEAFEP